MEVVTEVFSIQEQKMAAQHQIEAVVRKRQMRQIHAAKLISNPPFDMMGTNRKKAERWP